MIDDRPTKCNICGGKVIYGTLKEFGLKEYQSGKCYYCSKCRAYVGTHRNQPQDALGTLADGKTRALRAKCHEEFDKHYMSLTARDTLYYMLAKEMGIPKEECHFGHFNQKQLEEAMQIMTTKWKTLYIR